MIENTKLEEMVKEFPEEAEYIYVDKKEEGGFEIGFYKLFGTDETIQQFAEIQIDGKLRVNRNLEGVDEIRFDFVEDAVLYGDLFEFLDFLPSNPFYKGKKNLGGIDTEKAGEIIRSLLRELKDWDFEPLTEENVSLKDTIINDMSYNNEFWEITNFHENSTAYYRTEKVKGAEWKRFYFVSDYKNGNGADTVLFLRETDENGQICHLFIRNPLGVFQEVADWDVLDYKNPPECIEWNSLDKKAEEVEEIKLYTSLCKPSKFLDSGEFVFFVLKGHLELVKKIKEEGLGSLLRAMRGYDERPNVFFDNCNYFFKKDIKGNEPFVKQVDFEKLAKVDNYLKGAYEEVDLGKCEYFDRLIQGRIEFAVNRLDEEMTLRFGHDDLESVFSLLFLFGTRSEQIVEHHKLEGKTAAEILELLKKETLKIEGLIPKIKKLVKNNKWYDQNIGNFENKEDEIKRAIEFIEYGKKTYKDNQFKFIFYSVALKRVDLFNFWERYEEKFSKFSKRKNPKKFNLIGEIFDWDKQPDGSYERFKLLKDFYTGEEKR